MTEVLTQQWRDRVTDTEKQLARTKEELQAVCDAKDRLASEAAKFAKKEKSVRASLLASLRELEAQVHAVDEEHKIVQQKKLEAVQAMAAAESEYEELSLVVKQLQRQEKALKNREDLSAVLESESALWEREETELRDRIGALESQLLAQRTELKTRIKDAVEDIKQLDAAVKTARAARNPQDGLEEVTLESLAAAAAASTDRGGSLGAPRSIDVNRVRDAKTAAVRPSKRSIDGTVADTTDDVAPIKRPAR